MFTVGVYVDGAEENAYIQVLCGAALYSEAIMSGFANSVENVVNGLITGETLSDISLIDEDDFRILDSLLPSRQDLPMNRLTRAI